MTSDTSLPSSPSTSAPPDSSGDLDPAFMRMAGVLLLALLMALLDETIVNVGLKTLTAEFNSPLSTIQWVTGGYLLAVAVAAPFAGWAVDRFGGRTMWLVAVSVFVLGSLLSGLSWSPGSLIVFRVLQGLGGGMIVPVVQSVLAAAAGPSRVAKAMGLISIPLTLGPILGPIVGGALIDSISWRWMFLINLPIGLIALLLAVRTLPAERPSRTSEPLDLLGLALLSPGFAALVFGLTTAGHDGDFGAPKVIVAFVLGAALLVGYVVHALRTREVPLIDLRMFSKRGFTMAVITMFFVGAVANTLLFLTPLYYQESRGFSALHAGLLLIPSGFLGAAGAITSGKTAAKVTARFTSTVGMLITILGTLALSQVGPASNQAWLCVVFGVTGFGIGLTAPGTMAYMYQVVGPANGARATSALFIFNQIGGSLGIALIAVTLQNRLTGTVGSPAGAFGTTYWVIIGFGAVAALAALLLPVAFRAAAPTGGALQESAPS
ncbi:EmrB/QacA subfamily drug resistance transporter [Kitasatospora sp. MAA4]|uniref:DHA2 family efflux MFS transporter permease subunit n=1 Tax=Kitasatospora sp. MAA4 TaxID=3035093 RepID=UPI002475462C|nr:DHA2 family efflux MFS transporter permease subunit [Kitasatospora sp. MAA4]MDH6132404.1 EmrB/QacA subfamily drug resistance transporter [Kitasatospora sp. MAA4]